MRDLSSSVFHQATIHSDTSRAVRVFVIDRRYKREEVEEDEERNARGRGGHLRRLRLGVFFDLPVVRPTAGRLGFVSPIGRLADFWCPLSPFVSIFCLSPSSCVESFQFQSDPFDWPNHSKVVDLKKSDVWCVVVLWTAVNDIHLNDTHVNKYTGSC